LEKKAPIVFGDGNQTRDFVYVGDVVQAHMLAIRKEGASGQVFNIGTSKSTSINELAKLLIEKSGMKLDIIHDNPKEGRASRYQPGRVRLQGELIDFVMDNKKAKEILGWRPRTGLSEGVAKEIDWIKKNPSRWGGKPRV